MNQTIFQKKYPIYTLELLKSETVCKSIDDILARFKQKIEEHPIARFIALFDHYSHTVGLPESVINPAIKDAKNIIFCFGKDINDPGVLALRPRSIGVAELEKSFVITFLEAPNPMANSAMESWAKALRNS